jgi:hypothetical protein
MKGGGLKRGGAYSASWNNIRNLLTCTSVVRVLCREICGARAQPVLVPARTMPRATSVSVAQAGGGVERVPWPSSAALYTFKIHIMVRVDTHEADEYIHDKRTVLMEDIDTLPDLQLAVHVQQVRNNNYTKKT